MFFIKSFSSHRNRHDRSHKSTFCSNWSNPQLFSCIKTLRERRGGRTIMGSWGLERLGGGSGGGWRPIQWLKKKIFWWHILMINFFCCHLARLEGSLIVVEQWRFKCDMCGDVWEIKMWVKEPGVGCSGWSDLLRTGVTVGWSELHDPGMRAGHSVAWITDGMDPKEARDRVTCVTHVRFFLLLHFSHED